MNVDKYNENRDYELRDKHIVFCKWSCEYLLVETDIIDDKGELKH